jgi:hypothetical protein
LKKLLQFFLGKSIVFPRVPRKWNMTHAPFSIRVFFPHFLCEKMPIQKYRYPIGSKEGPQFLQYFFLRSRMNHVVETCHKKNRIKFLSNTAQFSHICLLEKITPVLTSNTKHFSRSIYSEIGMHCTLLCLEYSVESPRSTSNIENRSKIGSNTFCPC